MLLLCQMSSPACAGGIALLLSGLRARGLRWTPQRIKHAIENTARPLAGVEKLGQGHGVLQIEAAFEHLVQHASQSELDLLYRVSLAGSGARGIYLRDAADSARAFEASVQVEPVFREQRIDAPLSGDDGEEEAKESAEPSPTGSLSPSGSAPAGLANPSNYLLNKSKVGFQLKVALVCDAAWVDAPSHMILMHGGRTFSLVVHGETLPAGLHFTELLGYDAALNAEERVAQGPLFRVPITCCKPESPAVAHSALVAAAVQAGGAGDLISAPGTAYKFTNLPYDSARIHRRFVVVPEGASYADFTIRMHSLEAGSAPVTVAGESANSGSSSGSSGGSDAETSRSFMFHAVHLQPEQSYDAHECSSFFTLGVETSQKELRMNVRPGQTLEVCLAQYWSSLGACSADVEVNFNGILVDGAPNGELVLDATAPFHQVSFRSVLRTTKLAPAASLKVWCAPLRPQSAAIVQLSRERDLIANGTRLVSALNLTYAFELKEDSSAVKVRAPALNDRLYESVYESQLTLIFDSNKRFCFATDAFESGKALKSGKYTARLQVRHDDISLLERLKDMAVVVESALPKDIALPVYASYATAAVGGAKFGNGKSLKAGRAGVLYLGVESKPFPSFAKPGDWGVGTLVIAKAEGGATGKGGEIPLRVYSHPAAAPAASASGAAKKDKAAEDKSGKPAEGEQDPAFPKLEQKQDPASSPTPGADPTASPATGGGAVATNGAASASASSASSSSSSSSLATELRDLTIDHLNKLKKDSDSGKKLEALTAVLPPLLAQYPSHLPLLFLELRLLHEVNQSRARGSAERDDAAVAAKAQALLTKHIDQTALLAHFGRASPIEKDDAPAQAVRKEKEEIRKFVVKAIALQLDMAASELRSFVAQMRAVEYDPVARLALGDAPTDSPADSAADASASDAAFALSLANYHTLLAEAANWVDLSTKEQKKTFGPFKALATKIARHYGTLWRTLNADLATATSANDCDLQLALVQEKIQLLRALAQREPLYQHIVKYEQDWKIVRFPKEYQLF